MTSLSDDTATITRNEKQYGRLVTITPRTGDEPNELDDIEVTLQSSTAHA